MRIILILFGLFFSLAVFSQQDIILREQFADDRLDKVIKTLRKNHDLRFAYDGRILKQTRVSADLRGKSLQTGLEEILKPAGLQARFLGNTIAILAAEPSSDAPSQPSSTNLTWSARVVDVDSGESLPFASIQIQNSQTGTRSNEEGYFTLRNIPSDISVILISYVGYETKTIRLENFNDAYPREVELAQNLSVLPLVPIYGEQTRSQEQSETAGLITLQNAATRFIPTAGEPDIIRAIQFLPGIVASGESSGNLHIRGGDDDENLVLYDGFTIYHQDHFYGVFSAFNPESVKSIRVHRGWFEPRFGGRTAGLLEISGKDGNQKRAGGIINVNMLAANAQVETPLPFRKSSFVLSIRRSLTDVLSTSVYEQLFNSVYNASLVGSSDVDTDVFGDQSPDFRFSDLTMRLSLHPSDRDEVNLSLYSGNDRLMFDFEHQSGDNQTIEFQDDSRWGNLGISANWVRDWNGQTYSTGILSYSRYRSDLFAFDQYFSNGEEEKSISTDEHTVLEEYSLKQHLEFRLKSHEVGTGIWITNLRNDFRSSDTEGSENLLYEDHTTTALYLQDNMDFGGRFKALIGARLTHYSRTSKLYAEPRFSLNYALTKEVTLKMAGGRFHQFVRRIRRQNLFLNTPDFWRLTDGKTVPVLRSDQIAAGFLWTAGKWSLDVEAYYRDISGALQDKEQIQLGNETLDETAYLTGSGEVLGIDLSLQRTIGRHTGWISGTFVRSDRSFEALDQSYVRSSFQPAAELNAVYVLRLPKWRFSATFVYGSGRPFTEVLGTYPLELINGDMREIVVFGDVNGANLPDYHRMDISLHYFLNLPTSNIEIGASLYNLYNRQNITNRNYFLNETSDDDVSLGIRELRSLGILPSVSLRLEF